MFGDRPVSSSLSMAKEDELFDEGLTMGTLYIGKQGTGKTTALARHLVDYFKRYPDRAMFILDWSGSITDSVLAMLMDDKESLKRVIYDQLGNPEIVVPMPEFSLAYGGSYEDQIQRVVSNLNKLSKTLIEGAPVLGGIAVNDVAPHFFRLLTAMSNDQIDSNEVWQITEAKQLMTNEGLLRKALKDYGGKVPDTRAYLTNEFLNQSVKPYEREMRTFSIRALLNITDIREIKARLGYYRPGWTPREAIEKGKLVLIDGANLIGQEQTQHYLFTQVFSLIMAEIKRRRPANPADLPVSLILDEVYSLLSIPGMAVELSQLSPQYRSRKLQLYIVLQSLAQLSKELAPHIWSLGNIVCFAIANFNEAYEIAQQLIKYDPRMEKLPPTEQGRNPTLEADRGQYLMNGNWIQRLKRRECIIRRHLSESRMDDYVRHVPETKSAVTVADINKSALDDLKDALLKERGVLVYEALEKINRRHQDTSGNTVRPTVDL